MRPLLHRWLLPALRRLRRDDRAAAIVEFALVVPVMLVLYMGTIEVSDLIAVDRRVNVISNTMGDLVARADGCLTPTSITDLFKASEGIIVPYSKTGLKQSVSFLAVNGSGTATVSWSQAYNGGTARVAASTYPLPDAVKNIALNKWVVLSETEYAYRPLLGLVVSTAIPLNRTSFYIPREDKAIVFKTTGSC